MTTNETFEQIGINKLLSTSIIKYGYESPNLLQKKVIPIMLNRKDLIIESKSGSGKTISFILGLIQLIDYSIEQESCYQSIIIMPNLESALNNNLMINQIGIYVGIKSHAVVGGRPIKNDIEEIKKGVHNIIGTAGRIFELLERKIINIKKIKLLIINEADNLLDTSSKEIIDKILKLDFDKELQICINCITQTSHILEFANKYMRNPIIISS
jgi:translation initiation factor 4A